MPAYVKFPPYKIYTWHELMTAKQNINNRHLECWHWQEESKKNRWKIADLALKSFRLIYKSSNFYKYFGVDVITIIIVPKE
jgi:hypothetical protein